MRFNTSIYRLVLAVGTAFALLAAKKQIGPADKSLAKWTDQQVKKILVVPADRLFDRIGWVGDIFQAETWAKKTGRPIFYFTYDGDMAAGRC